MLKVINVSKKYNNIDVLKNVNLNIKKGEVVGILGKSGSGKSTLLKCINKLENIDSGIIEFEGKNINEIDIVNLRQKIGLVFQDYNLFEHLNILDNLMIAPIKIKNKSISKTYENAKNILKMIGLEEKMYNYPNELSGGQKQRVAIARTLLMEPKILLLDEPTSALDKETKIEVLKLIFDLVKKGTTLIIVSHEEEFLNKISNKIYKFIGHRLVEI